MKLVLIIFACASILSACQSSQSSSGGLSSCKSIGAGGTTDVICP